MPADVLFLIALAAVVMIHVSVWRAAKLLSLFSIVADTKAAGYALLSILSSATVLAVVALSLNWGAL